MELIRLVEDAVGPLPRRAPVITVQLLGEQRAESTFVSPYHFAYVYTGLGDAERAMDWLERAVAERTGAVYGVKGSFLFISFHAHPRFRALLRRMKLE